MNRTVFVVSADDAARLKGTCTGGGGGGGTHHTTPHSRALHSICTCTQTQGNLAWGTTAESLKALLESAAPVESVAVQTHTDTGRSKGWA